MSEWCVRLPAAVREPYVVYVNGVRQSAGTDYVTRGDVLVFHRPLVKEQRLGLWRWLIGAFGVGTYGRNDQVDVSWTAADGRPRVAHALDITGPPTGASSSAPTGSPASPGSG